MANRKYSKEEYDQVHTLNKMGLSHGKIAKISGIPIGSISKLIQTIYEHPEKITKEKYKKDGDNEPNRRFPADSPDGLFHHCEYYI